MRSPLLLAIVGLFMGASVLLAQDGPAVDLAAMQKELQRFRDSQGVQSKQSRMQALQTVNAAAANPDKAAALWEEAVHAVQFEGLPKDGVEFKAWREKEGDALNSPLAKNAARLYFAWLGITIQRDGGVSVKDLLPQIFGYIKDLVGDENAAESLEDGIRKDKEKDQLVSGAAAGKRAPNPSIHKDEKSKRMHDTIMRGALANSPIAQWMKISDFINPAQWERSPGNLDGIYQQIVLPEFRDHRDARALDYWDFKIKRDGDIAARTRLSFEIDKFMSIARPKLQWKRAEELGLIGQRNRSLGAMLAVIKANPLHPDAATWIAALEALLQPAPTEAAPVTPLESK